MTAEKRVHVSHLIKQQVARMVGVSQQAVTQREEARKLHPVVVFDKPMYPMDECLAWVRERQQDGRA